MDNSKANIKSYISSLIVLFVLMILTYVLTFIIPSGEYQRIINAQGNEIIDITSEFRFIDFDKLPFWKWLLSPVLVLGSEGSFTIIAVIILLIIIGGTFGPLNECNIVRYLIDKISYKYGNQKYKLIALLVLVFMLLGSLIGSFEEVVPLVPIVVGLMVMLGFDVFVGLGVSLIAVGCGFSTGIMNPFTIGVAQELAGVPMFSGVWLRIVSFVLVYALLLICLIIYAKRVEKKDAISNIVFEKDPRLEKATNAFLIILAVGVLLVLSSAFIKFLQDYTMIIVILMFLVAGIVSCALAKMPFKTFMKSSGKNILGVLPAVLLILMASSIKYILLEAKTLDTIMYYCAEFATHIPRFTVILFIYLIALLLEFFISSGSAKAFLLIPIIVPIAQLFNISPQLCILAYAFGDGFSNVFYPTNPVLLISLGLNDTKYSDYMKFSYKFALINLFMTAGILLFGLMVGY
ncbi:YfcC family protein [bacterium]|nr:YfcC family protein [bacterium]